MADSNTAYKNICLHFISVSKDSGVLVFNINALSIFTCLYEVIHILKHNK